MIMLTTELCADDDRLCDFVLRATDNEWLAGAANWLIAKPAAVLFLIVLGFVARWLLGRLIDRLTRRAAHGMTNGVLGQGRFGNGNDTSTAARVALARRQQRAETMGTVLKSIAAFTVFAIVAIMVLAEFGVNIGPLLAGAGIAGIALGFGAQNLVKDFLSGMFILFEDQFGIGDVVDLGDASGVVEAVSLRITRLRDVNGTVWYVRNGEILRVGNMSQNWARTVLDVTVGYGEDLARVRTVLKEIAHEVFDDPDFQGKVLEEPEVWGVERMEADGVAVRVAIKTAPLEQWNVARELRERIKARFDREGIEIPFPQRVVWHREDHPGEGTPGAATGGAGGTEAGDRSPAS